MNNEIDKNHKDVYSSIIPGTLDPVHTSLAPAPVLGPLLRLHRLPALLRAQDPLEHRPGQLSDAAPPAGHHPARQRRVARRDPVPLH